MNVQGNSTLVHTQGPTFVNAALIQMISYIVINYWNSFTLSVIAASIYTVSTKGLTDSGDEFPGLSYKPVD